MSRTRWILLALVVACGDDATMLDASVRDAALDTPTSTDGGAEEDAGPGDDAGANEDAGSDIGPLPEDAGPEDSGIDAGPSPDAGSPCTPGRHVTDQVDDESGEYQIHVLYVLASDTLDRNLDTNGVIDGTVSSFRAWFSAQEAPLSLRFDTCDGNLDISFVRMSLSAAEIRAMGPRERDAIETQVRAAGFDDPRKINLAYYDGDILDRSCGQAPFPPTSRFNTGVMYLQGRFSAPGIPSCASNPIAGAGDAPGYIEFSALHEVFHVMGAVAECAPNGMNTHTTDDPNDLMYAGAEPWTPSTIDVGRDDYFGHGRMDCYDLARSSFLSPTPAGAAPPPTW